MKVVLLAHTPTPEQTVAAAARLCYSDTDVEALRESISQERAEQFVEMLAGFGHESPVEHVTFTFGIEAFPVRFCTGNPSPHCFVFCAEPAVCAAGSLCLCDTAGNCCRAGTAAGIRKCHAKSPLTATTGWRTRWRRNMCRNFWHRAAPKRQPAPRRRKRRSRSTVCVTPTPVKPK